MSPSRKRAAAEELRDKFSASKQRACRTLDQAQSGQRYREKPREDEGRLEKRIPELVREHVRYGYRRIAALLKREGWRVNFKRVYRLWRKEGMKVP